MHVALCPVSQGRSRAAAASVRRGFRLVICQQQPHRSSEDNLFESLQCHRNARRVFAPLRPLFSDAHLETSPSLVGQRHFRVGVLSRSRACILTIVVTTYLPGKVGASESQISLRHFFSSLCIADPSLQPADESSRSSLQRSPVRYWLFIGGGTSLPCPLSGLPALTSD